MIKFNSQNRDFYESTIKISRITALIELVVFISFALISKEIMDPFLVPYSSQVTLITTIILLTRYVRLRGQNWSSMGLRPLPERKAKLLVIPQAILILITVLVIIISLTKGLNAIGITFMSCLGLVPVLVRKCSSEDFSLLDYKLYSKVLDSPPFWL